MKRSIILTTMLASTFAGSAIAAPSAKFAAVYGNNGPYLTSMVSIDGSVVDYTDFQQKEGFTFATIKVPQDKELLVGVSAEVGLTTDTSIKGKQGGKARSIAGASGSVIVVAHRVGDCSPGDGISCGAIAKPGGITLNSRVQELNATLGGVLTCVDGSGATEADGIINYDECNWTDEEVGLALDTVSANHFNFVLPNLDQGTYDITAYFTTRAEATVCVDGSLDGEGEACEGFTPSTLTDATVEASSFAKAFIGSYMVTVQQVRAVKGDLANVDIEVE